MNSETIVMCVVALILGMLMANMLNNVCGCKTVEGQGNEVGCCIAAPPCPGQKVFLPSNVSSHCDVSGIRCIVSYLKKHYNNTDKTLQGFQEFLNSDNTLIAWQGQNPDDQQNQMPFVFPEGILILDSETGKFTEDSPYAPSDNTSILDFLINNICDSEHAIISVDGVAVNPYSPDNSLYGPEGPPTFTLSGPGPSTCPNTYDCEVKYIHIWDEAYTYLTNDYTGSNLISCETTSCM